MAEVANRLGHVANITSSLKRYPDLNNYSNDELNEFLKESELKEFQKSEIKLSTDRLDIYSKYIFWVEHSKTSLSISEFKNFIFLNRIFFEDNLFELFSQIDKKLFSIIIRNSHLSQENYHRKALETTREKISEIKNEIEPIIIKTEEIIQKRLHFNDAK